MLSLEEYRFPYVDSKESLLTALLQKTKFLLALVATDASDFTGSPKDTNTVRNEGHIKLPKRIGKNFSNHKPAEVCSTILNGVPFFVIVSTVLMFSVQLMTREALDQLSDDDSDDDEPDGTYMSDLTSVTSDLFFADRPLLHVRGSPSRAEEGENNSYIYYHSSAFSSLYYAYFLPQRFS